MSATAANTSESTCKSEAAASTGSSVLALGTVHVPSYIKSMTSAKTLGSSSLSSTSVDALSLSPLSKRAARNMDWAESTTRCAGKLWSPTRTTTSQNLPSRRSAPSCQACDHHHCARATSLDAQKFALAYVLAY